MTNGVVELLESENTTKIDPMQLIGMTTLDWDALISELCSLKGIDRPKPKVDREPTEDEIENMSIINEET
jgi:hypothetical protein